MEKLLADSLILLSNFVFMSSVLKIVRDHVKFRVVQHPLPMFGSLVAILLLMCGQWVLGLYFSMMAATINASAYAYLLLSTRLYASRIKIVTTIAIVMTFVFMALIKIIGL